MISINQIRVGSVVRVRPDFGMGAPIEVKVDYMEEDVKNGLPGIGYRGAEYDRWAYLSQVDAVVTY
jgi:hypothetical protein